MGPPSVAFVGRLQRVRARGGLPAARRGHRRVAGLERRRFGPARVRETGPEAAGEGVAAALGDGVDDAAGEPAVLGGDAGGETCVSSIASSMKRFCGDPNRLSFTSTPFSMNTLSNANAPLIVTWPVFGVFSVRPGASCAMPWSVLCVAQRVDLVVLEIGADRRCRDRGRRRGDDLHLFAHAGRLQRARSARRSDRAESRSCASRARTRSSRRSIRRCRRGAAEASSCRRDQWS